MVFPAKNPSSKPAPKAVNEGAARNSGMSGVTANPNPSLPTSNTGKSENTKPKSRGIY